MDTLKVHIEDDGTITIETPGISQANHVNASELISFLNRHLKLESTSGAKPAHAVVHRHESNTVEL